MIKKLNIALITLSLLWPPLFAGINGMSALKEDINSQVQSANQEIENALEVLNERLNQKLDRVDAYEKLYCNIKGQNCENASVFTATDENESKDMIIHKIVGGWVGTNHSANQQPEPNYDFINIDSQKAIFDAHLCLEVHFKTSSEIKFAKPLYMDKTVVFCALESGGSGLININLIDDNLSDGSNTTHLKVAEGLGGWRCFNPDNNLGNAGTAFGYDSDGTRVVDKIDGVINNCLAHKTVDLST